MISDTGAIAGPNPTLQANYLNLLGSVLPSTFPSIKAVNYDDAHAGLRDGTVYGFGLNPPASRPSTRCPPVPTSCPIRTSTTTSVSISDATPPAGKVVVITAAVTGSDSGGTVAFLDNGTTIAGCGNVPVMNASSCETSSLPEGPHTIVADYLGDAADAPRQSAGARSPSSPPPGSGASLHPPGGTGLPRCLGAPPTGGQQSPRSTRN